MRLLAFWLFGSTFFSSIGFWPSGCGSIDPVSNGGSEAVSTEQAAVTVPDARVNESSGVSRYADPLVPPIVLDETLNHTVFTNIDFGQRHFISDGGHTHGSHDHHLYGNVEGYLDLESVDFSKDETALFEPHGHDVCASGCAASRHPTPELSKEEFRRLMLECSRFSFDENNHALESLLFYGRQTKAFLTQLGTSPLNSEQKHFLLKELGRTHALISFRVVDEHGIIRTQMRNTRVPLDRRHVFEMETERLPDLETSGTVKRVGLHHLWTRI